MLMALFLLLSGIAITLIISPYFSLSLPLMLLCIAFMMVPYLITRRPF